MALKSASRVFDGSHLCPPPPLHGFLFSSKSPRSRRVEYWTFFQISRVVPFVSDICALCCPPRCILPLSLLGYSSVPVFSFPPSPFSGTEAFFFPKSLRLFFNKHHNFFDLSSFLCAAPRHALVFFDKLLIWFLWLFLR